MLPFRSGRSGFRGTPLALLLIFLLGAPVVSGQKIKKRDAKNKASATPTPGDSLMSIPLPIGHEAKGLVLPNFDLSGHLTGKLEAGTARRIDAENIQFSSLKMTTFTDEDAADLLIEMSSSILNLKTRVISSKERTTVQKPDLNIVGDSMQYDTVSRLGKLVGHVKMVITGKARLSTGDDKADE